MTVWIGYYLFVQALESGWTLKLQRECNGESNQAHQVVQSGEEGLPLTIQGEASFSREHGTWQSCSSPNDVIDRKLRSQAICCHASVRANFSHSPDASFSFLFPDRRQMLMRNSSPSTTSHQWLTKSQHLIRSRCLKSSVKRLGRSVFEGNTCPHQRQY